MRSVLRSSSSSADGGVAWLDEARAERMTWWLAIAAAVTSVVVGILMLVWPHATLFVGAVLFGLWLLVHGIVRIVNAITASAADAGSRTLTGVVGVLFVLAGVFSLRHLLLSLVAVATVIGASWLIAGIVELVGAFGGRHPGPLRLIAAALGVIMILGGLVILIWPGPSLTTLVYLTGIWLLLTGVVQLILVLRTRRRSA
jgi:uncharacterized membrane protein HdeD (DUF308 family)